MPLRPPAHRTLQHQVLERVGSQIVAGRWAPGESLPTEGELAELLGASRGVVREAMKALVAKGLVVIRPKVGTRVRAQTEWNLLDPDVLRWDLEHERDTLIGHLIEARSVLDPGMAGLAARRATEADVIRLSEAVAAMAVALDAGDMAAFNDHDVEFHLALVMACHNPILSSLQQAVTLVLRSGFEATSQAPGSMRKSVGLHRSVLTAVRRSDPVAARRAAQRLIDASYADLAATVTQQPGAADTA